MTLSWSDSAVHTDVSATPHLTVSWRWFQARRTWLRNLWVHMQQVPAAPRWQTTKTNHLPQKWKQNQTIPLNTSAKNWFWSLKNPKQRPSPFPGNYSPRRSAERSASSQVWRSHQPQSETQVICTFGHCGGSSFVFAAHTFSLLSL